MCAYAKLNHVAVEFIVERVERFEWNDEAFEQLVIPPAHKTVLKTLVESQNAGASAKFDDFVSGKGHGLVINLFGNPGTGKSLTAEAMSECTSLCLCVSLTKLSGAAILPLDVRSESHALFLTHGSADRFYSVSFPLIFRALVCCGGSGPRHPC